MDIDAAIKKALDGNAVLFLGSGFSINAKNQRDLPFKTGSELSEHLAKKIGIDDEISLDDAAEEFIEQLGTDSLIDELKQEYTVKSLQKYHEGISDNPWRRVYTTNYDNLFEEASAKVSRPVTPITLSDNIGSIVGKSSLCVHLNGYINRLDRNSIMGEFKLTETSYSTASIENSPWIAMFRQDLARAQSVFLSDFPFLT